MNSDEPFAAEIETACLQSTNLFTCYFILDISIAVREIAG
jgi:hypothetical protein